MTRRRVVMASIACLVLLMGGFTILTATMTTRQGVNFEVGERRVPAYVKAIDFVQRHYYYEGLALEIAGGRLTARERALAVFEWTVRNVPPTPPDWPVIDDHISHIIIRGHGTSDQQADVFATLATYAGVPAFWRTVPVGDGPGVILAFARIDDRWRVFDVANRIVFRTASGALATIDDVVQHPESVPASARTIMISGVPYVDLVTRASLPPVPQPLRAELQMPLSRLWHETRTATGFETRDDSQ